VEGFMWRGDTIKYSRLTDSPSPPYTPRLQPRIHIIPIRIRIQHFKIVMDQDPEVHNVILKAKLQIHFDFCINLNYVELLTRQVSDLLRGIK
jgi:hypothetical protein